MDSPLPPPPHDFPVSVPPALPPKGFNGISPLNLRSSTSLLAPDSIPPSPMSPMSPNSPESSMDAKQKRANPLTDLIDTEKSYVDQLTGIIRKVAAAWSRSNLPPPELDTIFRSIEGVYKANRSLLAKLKEIGTNPSSPKALGDLLMRWIDDLEGPYTTYCAKFCAGFDDWDPVQSNARLPSVMSSFSATNPPPTWALAPDAETPTWTLDGLFLLPKARLKYYRKLYSRLLKSTTPGRSDHRLLVGALDKLDKLLDTLETREQIKVGAPRGPELTVLKPEEPVEPKSKSENRSSDSPRSTLNGIVRTSDFDAPGGSETSSARGSSLSSGERLSRETASTSISRVSSTTMTAPISDLERRLSTQRTLDIFTMKPKVVRLQMSPPTLQYTREFRFSMDAVVRFTPRSTGVEVVHRQGHLFLLSDLFLVCEQMSPEDRSQNGSDGPDMWLCYPPLAGKVLRVSEVEGQDNAIEIAIMRKETLIIQVESTHVRNFMLAEFKECIAFAGSLSPTSNQPVPPMPAIPSTLSQMPERSSPKGHLPPVPERSNSTSNERSTQSPPPFHPQPSGIPIGSTPSSSSQQFSASPGQIVPARSASYGSTLSRAGSNNSGFFPQEGPRPPYPQEGPRLPYPQEGPRPSYPQPPPHFSNNIQRAPSAPMPGGPIPPGPMPGPVPPRPPSEPAYSQPNGLRKSLSARSLQSQYSQQEQPPAPPPLPSFPSGGPPGNYPGNNPNGHGSSGSLHAPQPRTWLPSGQLGVEGFRAVPSFHEPSPPNSPVEETPVITGPITSTISAEMKCKVFLKQQHAQWKSLGAAKLKLYRQSPTNVKQLVVEAGAKNSILISTIVLTDGVERVGKTGVAIELSDKGARTGIVYMIQLRSEKSAGGLFDSLLEGSDRAH
ncbi:hypothetical protein DFH07DRAFT_208579 [Mycena maculata]|uniref:DH domain-containing protein n=1 Tax=Mycena maculata TaxID=230809 RepID=A0AAD7P1J0_9AGAR|nr:hypothetical protein DFH07DRAFT_208579 [Mycena maculata]